jgi:hypothetical protein
MACGRPTANAVALWQRSLGLGTVRFRDAQNAAVSSFASAMGP